MVDPAANTLVDKASLQSFVTVSSLTAALSPAPAEAEDSAALPTVTGPRSPVHNHRSSVTGQRETTAPSSSLVAVERAALPTVTGPQSLVLSHRSASSDSDGVTSRAFSGQRCKTACKFSSCGQQLQDIATAAIRGRRAS
jgi:hypothetical protein